MKLGCCTVTVPHDRSRASRSDVAAQAGAAEAICDATAAPPAGFVTVGDGPERGPKQ